MDITKAKPLEELELYELIVAAYPDKFDENGDKDIWDDVMEFAESFADIDELKELLGRLVYMTMPIESGLSKKYYHSLGTVTIKEDNQIHMISAVKRLIRN